jgi:hypothetical protein
MIESLHGADCGLPCAAQCNDLCLPMVEAPLPPAPHLNLKKTTGIEDIEKKDKKQEKDQDSQTATPGSQPSSDTDAGQTRDAATQQQPVQQQEQSQEQQQAQEKPQPLLISSNCSTAPFTAATGIKASSHLRLLRASALARSMDACGWVRLCGEDAVCPWEWLREALRDSVQDLINGAAADQLVGQGRGKCAVAMLRRSTCAGAADAAGTWPMSSSP